MVSFIRRTGPDRAQREAETNDHTRRLVATHDPTSPASEAYRSLRTNLLYSFVDNPPKAIVLTSPGPQEGKSTTCANLGVMLAQADKNVLMLDCDFRKPVLHRFFGMRNFQGLVDVLANAHSLQDVWKEPMAGLKVVPVGPKPLNPAEILGSERLLNLLAEAREEFDYVLIDAPPIGPVTDPAILAVRVDGVFLVLDAQKTRKGALRGSVRSLEAVGANILGTVMNNAKYNKGEYYYYDGRYADAPS